MEQVGEIAVPGDLPKADYDAHFGQGSDLGGEVGGAVTDLLGERLVAGRRATDDRGDPGVTELEAVVAGDGERAVGKAEVVEDGVHEVAGAVAGEGTAGAVGTMCTGGESKDQDAGFGVTEAWDGT